MLKTFLIDPIDTVGKAFTITTAVVEFVQALFTPLATVYVIVEFPADAPDTIPVVAPIVAIPVALLTQVPPVVVLVRVLDPPIQVLKVPVIALTVGMLVTVELGIEMVKSAEALEDAMLSVPV